MLVYPSKPGFDFYCRSGTETAHLNELFLRYVIHLINLEPNKIYCGLGSYALTILTTVRQD